MSFTDYALQCKLGAAMVQPSGCLGSRSQQSLSRWRCLVQLRSSTPPVHQLQRLHRCGNRLRHQRCHSDAESRCLHSRSGTVACRTQCRSHSPRYLAGRPNHDDRVTPQCAGRREQRDGIPATLNAGCGGAGVDFGATSEQERPNTTENQASSGTRRRSQASLSTTLWCLQDLHPRSNPGGASKIPARIHQFATS